ncbi:MAG: DNA cytosine methyltransferase [Acutalibacteraceae bacterium]|nr:DNA cytosine methyltransferase [Acutalibacteraceae bacterium]
MNGLSMFANVGIAETYLSDVGIDIVVANELLEDRAKFYKDLYPNCNMICGNILEDEVFENVCNGAIKKKVKFIIATPPCQGMSPAGKKDPKDSRNSLITSAVDMILRVKPDFVLIENVMQQLKTKIKYESEYILIPEYLERRLGEEYTFNDNPVIDTKFYGVPQQRKRAIFLLAHKNTGVRWEFPKKSETFVTLRDVIGDLPSLDPLIKEPEQRDVFPDYEKKREAGLKVSKWHFPREHVWRNVEVMMHTPEGKSARKNEVYFPKKKDGTMVGGAPRTYMRMEWDKPAPTITAYNHTISSFQNVHPGRPTEKEGIYSDARVLTIFELMRVMTLPDNWNIPEWATPQLIRQVIGEGIPPLLIKKIVAELKLGGKND